MTSTNSNSDALLRNQLTRSYIIISGLLQALNDASSVVDAGEGEAYAYQAELKLGKAFCAEYENQQRQEQSTVADPVAEAPAQATAHLIRIVDAEGDCEYDTIVVSPSGMALEQAVELVDSSLRRVKDDDPDGFVFSELKTELEQHGFKIATITTANEDW
jgi:hypothetical protein